MAKNNQHAQNVEAQVNTISPRERRDDAYVATAITVFSFLIYALTSAHSVTFEDSGLFISSLRTIGLPQPPGYPLYTLIGHLFTYLPFGSMAYRVHLFSNLCAAGGVLFLFLSLRRLRFRVEVAALAAFAFAIGDTYWSQAIVAEVYPLHVLLVAILFYLSIRIGEEPQTKWFLLFGIAYGCALANHWPLLLLASPLFLGFAFRSWREGLKKSWLWAGSALVVASGFYLFMMYRSQQEPPILFLGPIESISELLGYINRSYYRIIEARYLASMVHKFRFIFDHVYGVLWRDWLIFGGIMAVAGVVGIRRRFNLAQILGLASVIFSTPLILPFILKFEFNSINQNVIHVFHLGAMLGMCVVFASGIDYLASRQSAVRVFAFSAVLLLIAGLWNFHKNDLRTDQLGEKYARLMLDAIPVREKSTALVAGTDADVGPLSYVRFGLGERQDIRLYTQSGVFFKDRIFPAMMFARNRRDELTLQFAKNEGISYSTKIYDLLEDRKDLPFEFYFNGLFYEVSANGPHLNLGPDALARTKEMLNEYIENPRLSNWPYHREIVAGRLCNFLILHEAEHPAFHQIRACEVVLARRLVTQKKYEEADKVYRHLIDNSAMDVSTERLILRYFHFVAFLEWMNTASLPMSEKVSRIQELIVYATPGLSQYQYCDNSLAVVIRSLKGQIPINDETNEALAWYDRCPKTNTQ